MKHRLVGYDDKGLEKFEIPLPSSMVKMLVKFYKDDPKGIFCYPVYMDFFIEPNND
jgi:hypothetical protein